MYVLVPKQIGDGMMLPGTIPAVDTSAGEVVWVSGQAVVIGSERVYGRSVFKCAAVPTDLTRPPDQDLMKWKEMRPSNRYAPFDNYIQTAQVGRKGSVTYVLKVPFIDGLALHGLIGKRLQITVTDGVGGADLIPPIDTRLNLPRVGWWQYFFGERTSIRAYRMEKIPSRSSTVITITVSADASQDVGIGWMSVGNWTNFGMKSVGMRSGTQNGATAETVNFTFRKEQEDGTFRQESRGSSVNLAMQVMIDADDANRFFQVIDRIRNTPVSVYASAREQDRFMSTVGFVSVSWGRPINRATSLDVNVKGVV